ncbi:MAG TPA: RDD family protein [Thermoleophilaceae bacterium]
MNATAHAPAARTTGPKLDNRRVLAAIVDLAIVGAGTVLILFAADALASDSGDVRGALGAVILGWALYYYFALESGDGQTVGKKLLKLRVVRADGRSAGMREIAVRTVLRVVDGVGAYIVGLIVMLATGQRRQRLGDLAAGTIVIDASAPAFRGPAPVAEAPVELEHDTASVSTPTITLPSRPAAPTTLDDLSGPETPRVPEMRPFDPPMVEDEPVAEQPLPEVSTPSLEELAQDVAAARAEQVPVIRTEVEAEPDEDEPAEDAREDEPVDDEQMTVRSVETVSAIDLVMGGAPEEDASSEPDQGPEPPAAS